MTQPTDPLSQLAMCCGLGSRRRYYKGQPRNFFYSPSTAILDGSGNSGWPVANSYIGNQPQPYFLLTQPVILAGNPAQNTTNTMTLVQHAQTAPNQSNFPTLAVLGPQQQSIQPSIVSSQYAIYNTSAALNTSIMTAPSISMCEPAKQNSLDRNLSSYLINSRSPMLPIMDQQNPATMQQQRHQSLTKHVTLNAEVFRQLELIEKQVDLSKDMELIERHGIVITRALDPYSLMPYLSESALRRYHNHFLVNSAKYVIRFIEIIKRPGQTLGLYIRTVQFEDARGRMPRAGLVVTKIDTDSPIYNSPVLHVGDEIISVNLVDIQGMSLDDVVIIMSIPKRLVLAIRIPKDRDHLLNFNLRQHQQQQLAPRNLEQRDVTNADYQQQRAQVDDQILRRQASLQDNSRLDRGLGLQYNETQIGTLKMDTTAGLTGQDGSKLVPQSGRTQSAFRINEGPIGMIGENQGLSYDDDPTGNYSSRTAPWPPVQSLDRGSIMGRNMNRTVMMNHHELQPRLIDNNQNPTSKPTTSSRDEICHEVGGSDRFQGYDLDSDLKTLERAVQDEERSSRAEGNHQLSFISENTPTSTNLSMPSTLPRRTLPARPDATSSPTISIKQPIISNLRLADTPEQSSYFSSSIDAINRELKELRRQRMALSNHEHSIDSTRADY